LYARRNICYICIHERSRYRYAAFEDNAMFDNANTLKTSAQRFRRSVRRRGVSNFVSFENQRKYPGGKLCEFSSLSSSNFANRRASSRDMLAQSRVTRLSRTIISFSSEMLISRSFHAKNRFVFLLMIRHNLHVEARRCESILREMRHVYFTHRHFDERNSCSYFFEFYTERETNLS